MNHRNSPEILAPDAPQIEESTRRNFLGRATLMGAATVGAAALLRPSLAQAQPRAARIAAKNAPPAPVMVPTPVPTPVTSASDIAILSFALGLERLEAAFYAQILGAHTARAYLTPRQLEVAREIGAIEITHVSTLESAIIGANGTLPDAKTHRFPANVFISPLAFSWFGYTLEEIGIGAYLGAVGQIESKDLRKAAASIYGSETRHAAILRSLGGFSFAPRYFESPLSVEQVLTLVTPYIA